MAHLPHALPPHLQTSNNHQAAIFSPSIARAARSAAKDWDYVDGWLARKFTSQQPPPFERNADTLRALLALAAANEQADEERMLLARVEALALREVEARDRELEGKSEAEGAITAESAATGVLVAVEKALSADGNAALNAMAATAEELGLAGLPGLTPAEVGRRLVALQAAAHEPEQAAARTAALQRHVAAETRRVEQRRGVLATAARGAEDEDESEATAAAELAKQNLETQRRVRALATALPELRDRVAATAATNPPSPSIEEVRREEERYLDLLAQKRELSARVRSYQGLPPDADQARRELERMRAELRHITQRRDAFFEGLVERATPRKPMQRNR